MPQENRDFMQGFGEEYAFLFCLKKEDYLPNPKGLTLLIVHGSPVFLRIKLGDNTFYSII
jgi:hypothetical protein